MRHKHECKKCGTVWEHEDCSGYRHSEFKAAHSCPECGVKQLHYYLGDKEPVCHDHHLVFLDQGAGI